MPINLNLRACAEMVLNAYTREPGALGYDKKNVRQFQNTDSITYELIKHAELFNIIKGRVYPLKPNVFEDLLDKDRKRDIQTRLREIVTCPPRIGPVIVLDCASKHGDNQKARTSYTRDSPPKPRLTSAEIWLYLLPKGCAITKFLHA